jgi:hypothetical protein
MISPTPGWARGKYNRKAALCVVLDDAAKASSASLVES